MKWTVVLWCTLQSGDAEKFETKYKELVSQVKQARTPEGLNFLAEEFLKLATDAEKTDLYELALKAVQEAGRIATRTRNSDLTERVQERGRDLKARSQEFTKVKSAMKTLEGKPDDPAANLVVGKYLCFTKGDWTAGLPYLSRGSDADFRSLAALEEATLSQPPDTETKVMLGERWWPKSRERSLHWYQEAWISLNPLQKEKVRVRLKEALSRGEPKPKGTLPSNWRFEGNTPPPLTALLVDEAYAKHGRAALRQDGGIPAGVLSSQTKPIVAGKKYRFSAWVLTEKTPFLPIGLVVRFTSDDLKEHDTHLPFPADQPWWTPVEREFEAPPGTTRMTVMIACGFLKEGRLWLDALSVRDESGQELIENGSFEK
jgi:hypothetical protein